MLHVMDTAEVAALGGATHSAAMFAVRRGELVPDVRIGRSGRAGFLATNPTVHAWVSNASRAKLRGPRAGGKAST